MLFTPQLMKPKTQKGLTVQNKGLNKAFFNQIAIGLLLYPQTQYKGNKPPVMQNAEKPIIGTEKENTIPPVVNQRAYYDLQLALWYEIKSLVNDYSEQGQEFFTEHIRLGTDKDGNPAGLYWYEQTKGKDIYTPLTIRKENMKHFRALTIQQLECRMLEEYIKFSISVDDFIGRKWIDSPLTDMEQQTFNSFLTSIEQKHNTPKPLKKKDFPKGIQELEKHNFLEWLPKSNAYTLSKSAKGTQKGEYKTKAEAILNEKKIKAQWERWSKQGYIVKSNGQKYSRQGLTRTLETF